jgi:hypothetical protein
MKVAVDMDTNGTAESTTIEALPLISEATVQEP